MTFGISNLKFEIAKAGLLSVALVVISLRKCPDVIRLAALRCSDFPLRFTEAITRRASLQGSEIITKNVEHSNRMFQTFQLLISIISPGEMSGSDALPSLIARKLYSATFNVPLSFLRRSVAFFGFPFAPPADITA